MGLDGFDWEDFTSQRSAAIRPSRPGGRSQHVALRSKCHVAETEWHHAPISLAHTQRPAPSAGFDPTQSGH